MKPPLIQRLKSRLLLSGHKKQQGVAILTVLAIITLMTVLVISFFNMAQSAQSTAKGSVEVQRVTTLKDTIINLVIAQFREASALAPTDSSRPRDIITWTSQPGAIRTYSGTDSTLNRLFKLYSSDEPQLDGIKDGETMNLLRQINNDNEPAWAERPDEWADLNRPVYTSATGDRATATGATDKDGYSYPIADPRAYNGSTSDPLTNTEGFSYSSQSLQKNMRGVDARSGQLAMPVRWIYVLEDGTLGYLSQAGEFTALNGAQSGEVSRENPIVGRMAWWADDESCKINVNTASVPSVWDTPRTTSREDVWLANCQPLAGEYQRYPGHPATVDLSAVFFPGRRYAPVIPKGGWAMPIGKSMTSALSQEQAALIWDLAPFINAGGTAGGTVATPNAATADFAVDDHLFTSLDEMYFKAGGGANRSLNSPRDNLETLKLDSRGELLQRLERAQFFLTHKSHSPELTLQGFPRVSMYTMDGAAATYVGTSSTAAPPATVSPYDITMGVNSTIGGKAYYLQRSDPTSRHNEIFVNFNVRNVAVFKYLKELSRLPIPGYPNGYSGSTPITYPTPLTEDPTGFSLAAKYPAGFNERGGRFRDSGINVQNQVTLMDASDRTQILLNMLDFSRSLNMQPAFVNQSARYDGGNGQATGLCGCGNGSGDHNPALIFGQTYRTPKGAGKILIPAEITMVVNVAARLDPGQAAAGVARDLRQLMTAGTPSAQIADDVDSAGYRYFVEIGFVFSGFNPKHGWGPVQPNTSLWISTAYPGDPVTSLAFNQATAANVGNALPLIADLGAGQSEYLHMPTTREAAAGGSGNGTNPNCPPRGVPANIIPYGGMQGPRALMINPLTRTPQGTSTFAICSPLCYRTTEPGPLKVDLRVDPALVLRMMTLDGVANTSNVNACVDLRLPGNLVQGITLPISGTSLRAKAIEYNQGTRQFPDPSCATRSFVIPSGDYRLASGLRVDSDLFVAHANYASNGTSLYEANKDATKRMLSAPANYNPQTLINKTGAPNVPNYLTPQSGRPMSSLPLPLASNADMTSKTQFLLVGANTTNGLTTEVQKSADADLVEHASLEPARRQMFAFGRRDGHGFVPKRGSSDPDETGDFDNGIAGAEDGPYMNYPDEGDRRGSGEGRYFTNLTAMLATSTEKSGQNISPNFLLRSPVDFGSIPSGIQARVPWQTLRFRPDPGMNNPELRISSLTQNPPRGLPFANFCGPRDHFFLDMFWMPVVEPWAISEPFSTKGTINLNQQILPFIYIERTTALYALFRGERILAIPNDAADKYKRVTANGDADNNDPTYRYFLNPKETVRQFNTRYNQGVDPEGFNLAFNTYRSASEICETWLVPDKNDNEYDGDQDWTLEWTIGRMQNGQREGFWPEHRLTGDNSRERPYANLYPRVTVRSNVFKLHMVAQTLQKARSTDPKTFNSVNDAVTAEWRGSCLIERSADSLDTSLRRYDYTNLNSKTISETQTPRIDRYYTYRVTEVKQLTQ